MILTNTQSLPTRKSLASTRPARPFRDLATKPLLPFNLVRCTILHLLNIVLIPPQRARSPPPRSSETPPALAVTKPRTRAVVSSAQLRRVLATLDSLSQTPSTALPETRNKLPDIRHKECLPEHYSAAVRHAPISCSSIIYPSSS